MTTQKEEFGTYENQSFDHYPKAPMFPTGWDLSEMQTKPKDREVEASASDEEDIPNS